MSIIGAVGGAIVLGDKAKDLIFNYSKKQYTDKIAELSAIIDRLHKHLTELENLRAEINSFWKDAGNSEAVMALDKTIAITEQRTNYAKSLMNVFEKTVADMDQSQSALDAALDAAKTILGAFSA